jgi:phosphatidylglycerophosphate synthase
VNPFKVGANELTKIGQSCVSLIRRARRPLTHAICRLLKRLRVNQTHLTVFRMLLMAGFYFAWVAPQIWLAFALMFTSVLLDCVDGDLSRMLGNANAVGEFEDYFADNMVFLFFPLALMQTDLLQPLYAGIVIFSASCVLWMAERKQSAVGDSLHFHPKGDLLLSLSRKAVWILMYLYIFFRLDWFNPAYGVLAAALGADTAVNYFQIVRRRLKA